MLLEVRGVSKSFGVTRALTAVDFDLAAGETQVLFGENGAGKSTLVKILSGAYPADAGRITIGGRPVEMRSPHQARQNGIATVFQEFSLVPSLSVLDNLFLGREMTARGRLDRKAMTKRAQAVFERLNVTLDLKERIDMLDRASQQMIEIAKALIDDVRILILDEPTSSLTETETAKLFTVLKDLKKWGCGIIYISHRLDEVIQHGDRITVLRDGHIVGALARGEFDEDRLIQMITGQTRDMMYPAKSAPSEDVALSVTGLGAPGLSDISFTLRRGEILGLAGLAGSGASLIGRVLFGLSPKTQGEVRVNGEVIESLSPHRMLAKCVAFFPADRMAEGILPARSIRENAAIEALGRFTRWGMLKRHDEAKAVSSLAERMKIKAPSIKSPILDLSGGNQQKVVLSRSLLRDFDVLLLDDPTIGVDIQTKTEIYLLLQEMASAGAAILLASSDIEELMGLSHRIIVLREGRMAAAPQASGAVDKSALLAMFFPGRAAMETVQ